MREGWEIKKLTDVALVQTGKHDANHADINGKYRFFTCAYTPLLSNTKRFEGKCLILPGNGANVGEVFYYDGEFDAYQRTYVINEIKIYERFLYYHMKYSWRDLNLNKQFGSATNFLKIGNFKDYEVSLPKAKEQKEIVSILDDAFASIDKAKANIERNIENAKELFQSKLNEIFSQTGKGWENLKIIDLCSHKSQIVGGPFGSNLKVIDYKESGVPILRLQNIGKGFFIDKAIKFISKEKAEELAYHSFKSGDIVLAKLGIPIGKTCIVPSTFEYGIVVADVVRIRPNKEKITYTFLKHFLNSDCSVNQLSSEITGSTRPRVNIAEVRNLKISVPSLSKQKNVAGLIDDFENLRNLQIGVYEKELANLEELKKSILQKAFSGELTNKSAAA